MTKLTIAWGAIGLAVAYGAPIYASAQEAPRPPYLVRQAPDPVPPEQARLLAEINPTRINRYPSGSVVSLRAEEIDRIDLTSVLIPSRSHDGKFEIDDASLTTELEAAVERLRPLTLRNRPIDLAIRIATVGPVSSPGTLFVRLSERIDGLPVEPEGVITVDAATGRIQSFALSLVADGVSAPERSLWLTEEQAVAIAQRAVVSAHGGTYPAAANARLRLVRKSELELNPEWVVQFGGPGSYLALVDALTGEAGARSTVIH